MHVAHAACLQGDGDEGKSAGDGADKSDRTQRTCHDVNNFVSEKMQGVLESQTIQEELKLLNITTDIIGPRFYKHIELLLNVLVEDIYMTHFVRYESDIQISLQPQGKQTEVKVPVPVGAAVTFPYIGKVVHAQNRLAKTHYVYLCEILGVFRRDNNSSMVQHI